MRRLFLFGIGLAGCAAGHSDDAEREALPRAAPVEAAASALLDPRSREPRPLEASGRGAMQVGGASPLHVSHDGLVARTPDDGVGFVTTSVRRTEGAELAGVPTPRLSATSLELARGKIVERFASNVAGLEQSFTFPEAPPGGGDLVVRVATPGLSFVRRDARGLVFDGATGPMTYGHATWIDATGRRTAVATRASEDGIELRLSARVLAESQYPAVLDPVIFGPQFLDVLPTDAAALAIYDVETAAVVFTGTSFFAAWSEDATPGPTREKMRSKVVTVDGAPVEATSQISSQANARHVDARLAYSSGRVALLMYNIATVSGPPTQYQIRFHDPTTGAYQGQYASGWGQSQVPMLSSYASGFAVIYRYGSVPTINILATNGTSLKDVALFGCGQPNGIGSKGDGFIADFGCRLSVALDGSYVGPILPHPVTVNQLVWANDHYVGVAGASHELIAPGGASLAGPLTTTATGGIAGLSFDGTNSIALVRDAASSKVVRIAPNGSLVEPDGVQILNVAASGGGTNKSAVASTGFQRSLAVSRFADPVSGKFRIISSVVDFRGAPGDACSTGSQCASDICADNVCCDTACGGSDDTDCQACSTAKGAAADGTCGAVAATKTCRASTEVCDVAEACDGQSFTCPADGFASATVTCRDAAGVCDKVELCTGSSPACPADEMKTVTTKCRSVASSCDAAEFCDAVTPDCPADASLPDGTLCSGGACNAGLCVGTGGAGGSAGAAGASGSAGKAGAAGAAGSSGGAGTGGSAGSAGKAGAAGASGGSSGAAGASGVAGAANGGAAGAAGAGGSAGKSGTGGAGAPAGGGAGQSGNGGAAAAAGIAGASGAGGAGKAGAGGAGKAGASGQSGASGQAGKAGSATGGSSGSGAAGGSSGAAGAKAGSAGSTVGSGGAKAGSGGSTVPSAGSAGSTTGASSAAPAEEPSSEGGGCGCAVVDARQGGTTLFLGVASLLVAHARRRRRAASTTAV